MTFKVIQGHRKWRDSIGHISLPISDLYLAQFPRLTGWAYTGLSDSACDCECDLKKSFSFNTIVEITGYMRFPINV